MCIYKKDKCSATVNERCPKRKPCAFYTTEKMHREGIKKTYARLKQLSEEKQTIISIKYYGAEKPWKGAN